MRFIRSFEQDYRAKPEFLTDNYRSTHHIIEAANAVIEPARDRMKVDNEIRIDRACAKDAPGGLWAERDPVGRGRVQILSAGRDAISQAQAAMAELGRLASLESDWDWSTCAVIAREWAYLEPVRSICELEGIPVQMANEELPSVWHLRETQALLAWLRKRDSRLVRNADLREWLSRQPPGPWIELLREAVEEHEVETGAGEGPVDSFVEWLDEWGREVRRRQRGLLLLTAHRAKGLEFRHVVVLDGRLEIDGRAIGFEVKRTERPSTTKSMHSALADLALDRLVVVHAGEHRFALADRITAIGAADLLVGADPLAGL